jgi:excisionase family DNA binding protein
MTSTDVRPGRRFRKSEHPEGLIREAPCRVWTTPGSPWEAADLCGMAYRKMLNMVRRGGLPAEKPRKEWRVRRTEVEAFIERSRVKPGEVKAAPGRP